MIKKEVEAREASEGAVVSTNRPNGPVPRNPLIPSASSLVTNSSNCKPECVYCDDGHYSASCTKVTSVTDRKGILLKTGRCFNCLKTRHKSRDCIVPEPVDIVTSAIISQYVVTFQLLQILRRLVATLLQVQQQEPRWVKR